MRGAFLLFRLSLKRVRLLLCATGLLLAAVQALRVRIAAEVHDTGQFDKLSALLPSAVRDILGPSLGSIMSFNGIVSAVYFDTGFIIALLALAITLATLPASEIETGFADLILARPLARHWLITRTIALVLFSILLMLLMIMAGTWAGLALFAPLNGNAPWPTARQTGSLALTLGLLVASWSGVAMALGAGYRRGAASGTTALLAFAALLLDWAHRLWAPLDCIAWLSPFFYFNPYELVAGGPLPVENLVVLGAMALTGFTVAYFIISQRDISR
jgi:ABC-2 type transport system permease protein